MLTVILVIAVIVVVALAGFVGFAAMKPDSFRVERATSVKAPAEKIFPFINDFHRWGAWSPYEHRDPAMQRTYGAITSGMGAVYEWNGNKNIGSGRMEITEASPPKKIVIKLDFFRPFKAHNVATFTMEPQGDATRVTWAMHGPQPFIGKVMGTVLNMDKMIGTDFEMGLANLKRLAEK